MVFYLDDCADANDLVLLLRQVGYAVRTPRTEQTRGVDDAVHLGHAAARGFTLVTKNPKDFRDLHQEWQAQGRLHYGILLIYEDNIRGKDMEPADIVRAIGKLLASGLAVRNELHVLNHWQ
jgi:Domain of unknown function (DUF5615)